MMQAFEQKREPLTGRAELPLLFAIFLDLVGFGMMFPDVQLRAQEYGAPGWLIGVILASYYLVQMVVSPHWGRLSDRIGRKPVLLLCGATSAASMVVYALGHNTWWMFASRLAAGFGAANVVVAQAYIADTTPESDRAPALGRVNAAVSAGLVLGPVIGGFLAARGGNFLLGMTAAAASGIGVLWILVGVPHQAPTTAAPVVHSRPRALLQGNPALVRLVAVAVVGWFALASLEGTFGRLIQHNLGFGQMEFGLLLGLEAGVACMQGVFYQPISQRMNGANLLRASYGMQAVGLGLMPFAPGLWALILLSILFGVGLGIAGPTINGMASGLTTSDRQGELFGLLQSCRAMGFLVGPILGGVLFDWKPAAPYIGAFAIMAIAALAVAKTRTVASV
jgi:MFS family permease